MPENNPSSAGNSPAADGDTPAQDAGIPMLHRIGVRIGLGLITFFVVALTATVVAVRTGGRSALEAQALRLNTEIGSQIVLKLEERLSAARTLALAVAETARSLPADTDLVMRVLPATLDIPGTKHLVAGGGYWPEPGRFTPGVARRSFFWARDEDGLLNYVDGYNSSEGRGYHHEEWYVPARFIPAGGVYWSRSYTDPYSFEPMVTCTAPVWSGGEFVGASTIDVKLTGLDAFMEEEARVTGGYAFAMDHHNRLISFPQPTLARRITIGADGTRSEDFRPLHDLASTHEGFRAVDDVARTGDERLAGAVRALRSRGLDTLAEELAASSYQIDRDDALRIAVGLLGDEAGRADPDVIRLDDDHFLGEPVVVSIFAVRGAHWKIVVVTPARKAILAAGAIERQITGWMILLLFAVCLVAAALSYRHLVRPLRTLLAQVKTLETSDDDTGRIRLSGRDELARIAYWFNARTTRLAHALTQLRRKNQALERATREAEEASRSKNVFLASMSHEIRTPMNAIIGMTGILRETRLTSEQADFASTIQTSADSLLSLINDIMDFSKIEAGKLDMEALDFDVRVVLDEVCDLIGYRVGEKGLDLVSHFNPRAPSRVRGDPGRLRQILLNLAANAVKFTTSGLVSIHGDIKLEPDGRPRLSFEVRDSGIGIPRESLNRLFKPFSQVDDSTTRRYGGTGLGLAICRRLCEMMDGSIDVESIPGSGSTFRFHLLMQPVADADVFPTLPAARHALIVDHSAAHRRVLRDVLESWSFVVAECGSIDEVGPILGERRAIDVVFSGVSPENTRDVSIIVQRMAVGRHIDLVVHATQHQAARYAPEVGSVLRKPLKVGQLVEKLQRLAPVPNPRPGAHTARPGSALPTAPVRTAERVRVLIVEDNPVNQKVAQRLVAKLGYASAIVADGQQAFDAVTKFNYDLILMDWQMPVLDGLEATRAIRALGGRFAHLPIVAVTANAMQGDRERCLAAGMNDYLSKPIAPDKLRAIFEQWMIPADGTCG